MKTYRYVVPRVTLCKTFGHWKDVRVCIASPYRECNGCTQKVEDKERYFNRTHQVVESISPPGPGYVGKVIVIENSIKGIKHVKR